MFFAAFLFGSVTIAVLSPVGYITIVSEPSVGIFMTVQILLQAMVGHSIPINLKSMLQKGWKILVTYDLLVILDHDK